MKTIMLILFVIAIFALSFLSSSSQQNSNQILDEKKTIWYDSLHPPVIQLVPTSMEIPKPKKGKFITQVLKVNNIGGSPLEFKSAKGSCYCASATILQSPIDTSSSGKIMLYINLDGLYEANNVIEYTIESNAVNSPTTFRVTILPNQQDSLKK